MNFNLDGIKSRLLSGVSSDSELRQLLSAALTQKKEQPDRTWGMSPEMKRIIRNSHHVYDVFTFRTLIVYLGFYVGERLLAEASNCSSVSSSSSSAPTVDTKDELLRTMTQAIWELNFETCAEPLIKYIAILQRNWDPSFPVEVRQLLDETRRYVESSPERCIKLSEADADIWRNKPLRDLSRSEAQDSVKEALNRYRLLVPALTAQLHASVRSKQVEVAKEQRLRASMREAGEELFDSLHVIDGDKAAVKMLYDQLGYNIAECSSTYNSSDLDLCELVVEPLVRDLCERHLNDLTQSTRSDSLSRYALEHKENLAQLNKMIYAFFVSIRSTFNEMDHLLLMQYFAFHQALMGRKYTLDSIQQAFEDFQEPYKAHQHFLERRNDLIDLCLEATQDRPEQRRLFETFRERCEELRWHYRQRYNCPEGWRRLSDAIVQDLDKAFPATKPIPKITAEELEAKREAERKLEEAALAAKAHADAWLKELEAEGEGSKGRTRGRRSTAKSGGRKVSAIAKRKAPTTSRLAAPLQPASSSSASVHVPVIERPVEHYEHACDRLIAAFETVTIADGPELSPSQKAKKSSMTQVIDALLELRDLPQIRDAEAMADSINTLLYAVSLASEQALFAQVLEAKGVTTPYAALRYASHNQRWLLSQLGEVSPEALNRVGEVDRLEFYVRSLYSQSASNDEPTGASLLRRSEQLRKGHLSNDEAQALVVETQALVQRQLAALSLMLECPLSDDLWQESASRARTVIQPTIHLLSAEPATDIGDILKSKISETVRNSCGAPAGPSAETFYADAERSIALVQSRQRRQGSLRNHVKQTLRGKAQFLLNLGIALECEGNPEAAKKPLSEFTHNMWEYISKSGRQEANFTPEEINEIYATCKANSSVRYHPLFQSTTGTVREMMARLGTLNTHCLSEAKSDEGFKVALKDAAQRQAGRLQKECASQLQACLSIAGKLLG